MSTFFGYSCLFYGFPFRLYYTLPVSNYHLTSLYNNTQQNIGWSSRMPRNHRPRIAVIFLQGPPKTTLLRQIPRRIRSSHVPLHLLRRDTLLRRRRRIQPRPRGQTHGGLQGRDVQFVRRVQHGVVRTVRSWGVCQGRWYCCGWNLVWEFTVHHENTNYQFIFFRRQTFANIYDIFNKNKEFVCPKRIT